MDALAMDRTRLERAQWFAAKGISVFIVEPNSKRPLEGVSWYTRQSDDPDKVAAWFEQLPNCNYGVHPGADYVVIDLDVKPDANGVREFEKLCAKNGIDDPLLEIDTLIARTPGGGFHFYFKAPFPCANRNAFADGIDVRGAIGYVVGAASADSRGEWRVINDADIAPLPDFLLEYVKQVGRKSDLREIPVVEDLDQNVDVERAREWLRDRAPAIERQNGDDWTYETCCYLRDFGLSPVKIFEVLNEGWNQKCEPPWSETELSQKITNAFAYGQNRVGSKAPSFTAQRLTEANKHITPEQLAALSGGAGKGADDGDDGPRKKSNIFISSSKLIENLEELNDAVVSENLDLFERGGSVVSLTRLTETEVKDGIRRPVGSYVIGPVNPHVMQYHAMTAATFWKWNERAKDYVETECPKKLIDGYLNNHHVRSLRPLHGIAEAPTLRPDGSVLQDNGYDPKSAMFVELRGNFPTVPDNPTREDAQRALTKLRHVVRGIMFDGKTSTNDNTPTDAESVWLAAALTSVIRGAIPTAPMFGFSAPTKGSGKTLAADLVGIIATGNDVPAMSIPDSEEEIRKTLFASLLAGDEVVLLDNVKAGVPLRSDALNAILTKSSYEGRVLGASTILTVPVVTTFLASGNNFSVDEDLRRRTLVCYIDPRVENPDQRRYDWDARVETRANRPELVTAVLTIIRAFLSAREWGDPTTELELVPYGSFEDWDKLVRYPLVWLGMPDPANTRKLVMTGSDIERQEQAFVAAWSVMFGDTWVRVRDAAVVAQRHYDDDAEREKATALREILEDISDDPKGGIVNRKTGEWMASRHNRVIGGKRFEKEDGHVQKWRLASLN